eukprot:856048_1
MTMTIESTQVVYLVAPAGTGKSFSGDYLQVVHGYKHVDGDGPIKNMAILKYREITKDYFASGGDPNLGNPYFEEIAKQTLDAAKDHDRVVLTHATYNQVYRDVVIDTLVEGGISKENITLIELTIDPIVKLRGLYHRTKRQLEQKGKTMEERHTHLEYEGAVLTEEKYIKAMMEQQGGDMSGGDEFEDCPMAKKIDVSDRVAHLSNIDEALGLTRSSEDWTYETICDQVLPIDIQRDEECVANGSMDVLLELMAELRAASQAPTQQDSKEEQSKVCFREESASSCSEGKHTERTYASSSWEMGRTNSW